MGEENSNITRKRLSLLEYSKIGIESVYKTFLRFPLTILLFVALAGVVIYEIETPYREGVYEITNRLTAVLLLGITLSLTIQLLFERFLKKENVLLKLVVYFVELIFLAFYYVYLFPNTNLVPVERLLLISVALILSFLFVPYLYKKENFELYITKIITRLVTTIFFTTVVALGLTATLFAIESLLYNELKSEFYLYIWVLSFCIFAPLFFLYGLPKKEDTFNVNSYNKILQVLMLYIILPILSIFTVVLYIYFGKILITQVWPEGIVSYLVLSYTAVGITSIFLISPLKTKSKWARIFISIFTKAIFPLLAIMFVSIGIRIGEYGFTENRYYILVIGIWATFAMLFVLFNRGKNNIVLPISLAIVAFLIVIGPWSAFNVSMASQTERFQNILTKYDMIENGKVAKKNNIIEDNDKREIIEIIRYFNYSHELKDLTYLPEDFELYDMEKVFGFSENIWYEDISDQVNFYLTDETPRVITGYDVVFDYKSYYFNNDKAVKEFSFEAVDYKLIVDRNFIVTIERNDTEIYRKNLKDFAEILRDKYGSTAKSQSPVPEDMAFIDNNDEVSVMYTFNQIYGLVVDNEIDLENVEVDIYINIIQELKLPE